MYKATITIKIKQNNPLSLFYHYQHDDLTDMDLTLAEIKCYVKDSDKKLILKAVVNPIELSAGKFNIDINSVPFVGTGILFLDVKVSINDRGENNDIIKLIVSEVVTDV